MPDLQRVLDIRYPRGTKISVTRKGYRVGETMGRWKTESGVVVQDCERFVAYRVRGAVGSFVETFLKVDLITGDVKVRVVQCD